MAFQKESEARQAEGLSYGPAAGLWPSPNHAQRPEAVSCRLCLAGEHRLTGTKAKKKKGPESERTKADRLTGRKKNFQRHCGFITPDGKDQKLSRAKQP